MWKLFGLFTTAIVVVGYYAFGDDKPAQGGGKTPATPPPNPTVEETFATCNDAFAKLPASVAQDISDAMLDAAQDKSSAPIRKMAGVLQAAAAASSNPGAYKHATNCLLQAAAELDTGLAAASGYADDINDAPATKPDDVLGGGSLPDGFGS